MPYAKLALEQKKAEPLEGLPPLLKTPSGLALIELQGRINVGSNSLIASALDLERDTEDVSSIPEFDSTVKRHLGEVEFVDNNEVLLNIGNRQLLRGKIVELKPPVAVLDMQPASMTRTQMSQAKVVEKLDIPVLEIIRHQILFNNRPEPVVPKTRSN